MKDSSQRLLAAACVLMLASCSTIKSMGVPWFPQGPAAAADEARAKRENRPAGTDPAASQARTTPPPSAAARTAP